MPHISVIMIRHVRRMMRIRTEWHEHAGDKDNQSIGGTNERRTKREESRARTERTNRYVLSVLCGEGKLKQLTALPLTRVKGEKRPTRSEKRRLSGEIRLGGCEQEGKRKGEGGRTRRTCGRDSIKRTHINESFQSKTELYAGASISTRVRHACTYT